MWTDAIQVVQSAARAAKENGYPIWFRGQRDANWPLLSSLHRNVNRSYEQVLSIPAQAVPEGEKVKLLREAFKSVFHKFKGSAVQLLPEYEKSDWGLIFAMQHLGIPTTLLDWTESFPCALYFAQRHRNPSDDAAIFIFNPEQHNRTILGKDGLIFLGGNADRPTVVRTHQYHPAIISNGGDLETIAVQPEHTNARMVAQQSAFTLSGVSFQPLEERYPQSITKIVLRVQDSHDAQDFLELTGRTHFGYFPDLEGLRDYLMGGLEQEIALAKEYNAKKH